MHHGPVGNLNGARWLHWLPAVMLVLVMHTCIWLSYTHWQTVQNKPRPLPSVSISLISAPAPQEVRPAPQQQRKPAAPKQSATAPVTPATPAAAASSAPEEPAAPAESKEVAPPAVTEDTTPPIYQAAYLNNPPPIYPLVARRRGIEGTVVIRAQITEDGNCSVVNLSKSSGYEMLDQAALAAVKTWRFIPAQRGSQAINAWVVVPITFRLSKQNEQS